MTIFAPPPNIPCKICAETSNYEFSFRLLNKHDVLYFRCKRCGFLQTEAPYWLEESYSSVIAELDIGLLGRAINLARYAFEIIEEGFEPSGKFLDWGGGYGVLVRLMRDRGYNFYWRDPYCQNLFAKGFEVPEGGRFEMLTAIEVFEHLPQPMSTIEAMLELSPNLLFTTEMQPTNLGDLRDWWYLAPESGQHISFYTEETLLFIANKFRLNLATDGRALHLLSKSRISSETLKAIVRNSLPRRIIQKITKNPPQRESLLSTDYEAIRATLGRQR